MRLSNRIAATALAAVMAVSMLTACGGGGGGSTGGNGGGSGNNGGSISVAVPAPLYSSAASDVYKRQVHGIHHCGI